MAIHSETRFLLLEYPPEHLATVLALQELVGGDLLKVAGILNDKPDEPGPPPGHGPLDLPTSPDPAPGPDSFKSPPFSRADFIVGSSAPDSKIATMICSVWNILVERSPFYIPENVPKASPIEPSSSRYGNRPGLPLSPLVNPAVQYTPLDSAAVMMGFRSPTAAYPHSHENAQANSARPRVPPPESSQPRRPHSPVMSSASSFTETTRSSKTAQMIRAKRAKLMNFLGRDAGTASGSTPRAGSSSLDELLHDDDDDDDEESELAADERKYIPLFNKTEEDRRVDSRKALKFLGLTAEEQ